MNNIVPLHRNVVHIPSREEAELIDQYEWLLRGGYGDCADAHRATHEQSQSSLSLPFGWVSAIASDFSLYIGFVAGCFFTVAAACLVAFA